MPGKTFSYSYLKLAYQYHGQKKPHGQDFYTSVYQQIEKRRVQLNHVNMVNGDLISHHVQRGVDSSNAPSPE